MVSGAGAHLDLAGHSTGARLPRLTTRTRSVRRRAGAVSALYVITQLSLYRPDPASYVASYVLFRPVTNPHIQVTMTPLATS